jgi:hypothetical protein
MWNDQQTPFCLICLRFMTPHAARAHSKHAKAIVYRKKKDTKKTKK